jgi:hypothetical protein
VVSVPFTLQLTAAILLHWALPQSEVVEADHMPTPTTTVPVVAPVVVEPTGLARLAELQPLAKETTVEVLVQQATPTAVPVVVVALARSVVPVPAT